MEYNKTELSVNTEVFEKMAELAAKEIDGVVGLTKKNVDLKGFIKTKQPLKGVKVENINGSIQISVFICVDRNANIKEIAEKVQENIKDKIQTMTGTAVTKVNVEISDINIPEETTEE